MATTDRLQQARDRLQSNEPWRPKDYKVADAALALVSRLADIPREELYLMHQCVLCGGGEWGPHAADCVWQQARRLRDGGQS